MAVISQVGIVDGQVLYAEHILRIINALSALSSNDILISGNLYNTGSFYQLGTSSFAGDSVQISSSLFILPISVSNDDSLTRLLVINPSTGRISYKNSTSLTSSANFSGSFSGSFQGDGSNLTGIVSSKWTGSTSISRQGDVSVTGSLRITSALTSSIISASSGITGSLFGTSSWATNSSQSISSSAAISSSISQTSSFARSGNGIFSGSFSGSFQGDGSNLTGIVSSKWTGSTTISRLGNVTISGSFNIGENTTAIGSFTHAEGFATTASNGYSHAEGNNTQAKGNASHAEGASTIACGSFSHAEGVSTIALGTYSHTEGSGNIAIGEGSHVEGYSNSGSGDYSLVIGAFNKPISASAYAFIIGNGVNTGGGRSNLVFASASKFEISGSLFVTNSIVVTQNISASIISGSFYGDGSNLTGVIGGTGSSKWTGSSDISRLGNVSITGSLNVSSSTGTGFNTIGTSLFTGPITASIISASSQIISNRFSGSFSGSFQGDGSQLTGIAGGSSKWTGSTNISRLGNVEITGSIIISASTNYNIIGASSFTGPITASIISGSAVTGSLFGTSSWATNASQSISSSVSISSSFSTFAISSSYATSSANSITASYIDLARSASVSISSSISQTSSFARSGNGIFSGSFSGSYVGDGSGLTGIAGGSSKWTGSTTISRLSDVNITGSFVVSGSNQVNILGATQFTGPITASFISSSGTFRLSGSTAAIITGSVFISGTLSSQGAGNILLYGNDLANLSANTLQLSGINTYLLGTTDILISSPKIIIGSSLAGNPIVALTGSLIVSGTANNGTGGITGSLLGTASFATTASYAYNTINPAVNSDQRYFESTDFAGTVQGDLGIFIGGSQFGGGVIFSDQYGLGTAENVLGVYRIFTGTSTSGSGWMYKGYSGGFGNAYLFGRGNALTGRWRIAISSSLSSSNNDIWTASIGFMDNGTNNSYGAYFRWSPAENSGRWRAILQKGLTSSSFDTGIVANTSYSIFQIESNISGTAVTFSIDDVPVASGSSNISTGSAESFGWWVSVQKASGSENRGIAIDWYSLGLTRNEPR